jgi:hypothetical protein
MRNGENEKMRKESTLKSIQLPRKMPRLSPLNPALTGRGWGWGLYCPVSEEDTDPTPVPSPTREGRAAATLAADVRLFQVDSENEKMRNGENEKMRNGENEKMRNGENEKMRK